jgi:predicted nuclease with RNAse H fold
MKYAGIDYGSKIAGTTCIAYIESKSVKVLQSEKNKDADQFIKDNLNNLGINSVFIDAPLTLPGVYATIEGYDDYFYREGDKICGAMSPMFLGGLTARAMKLKNELPFIFFQETYPSQLMKVLNIDLKKIDFSEAIKTLGKILNLKMPTIKNKHQFDSICALVSHYRYCNGKHISFGHKIEGTIIV